jgi:hypothetical protein
MRRTLNILFGAAGALAAAVLVVALVSAATQASSTGGGAGQSLDSQAPAVSSPTPAPQPARDLPATGPALPPSQPGQGIAVGEPHPSAPATRPAPQPSTPQAPVPSLPAKPDEPVSSRPAPIAPGAGAPPVAEPVGPGIKPAPADSMLVQAPLEGSQIRVMESSPPSYVLNVQVGLPGGCARAAGYEVSRSGSQITVVIMNSMPATPVPCTMIYGLYSLNIPLGSDFQSGQTYSVQVNDRALTLKAQ